MATGGYQFEQPAMNWDATDMYEEFKRFKNTSTSFSQDRSAKLRKKRKPDG
jgi:hypothetical protein